MSDPLSVSASVAGLITVAELVFRRSFKYLKEVKEGPNSILRLSSELGGLHGALQSIHLVLTQLERDIPDSALGPNYISSCEKTLHKITTVLEKHETSSERGCKLRTVRKRLNWPFSLSETEDLIAEIERHKSTLSLALTADGLSGLLHSLSIQRELHSGIMEIKHDLRRLKDIQTRISLDKDNEEILNAIGNIDPYANHQTNLKLRHTGTGRWFTDSKNFKSWLDGATNRLWMYGIPGAGKTVLCASAIEAGLERCSPDSAMAFFYCDYKDTTTQNPSSILGSLAVQIAKQSDQSFQRLKAFYKAHNSDGKKAHTYDPEELRDLIMKMAWDYSNIMIIIDALDECGTNISTVTDLLTSLNTDGGESSIRTLFSSRDELDIREILAHYSKVAIAAEKSDLRLYVGAEIHARDRKLRIKDHSLKERIMNRLVEDADGMFRWVTCQLDYLCELPTDAARKEALNCLPPTLNATYERILRRFNERNNHVRRLVQRALRWIVHAHGTIDIDALSQALSIEKGQKSLSPDAIPDCDQILRWCSSLLRTKVSEEGTESLELAHFTVKEFLMEIGADTNFEFVAYRLDEVRDNKELATVCLTYLNLPGKEKEKYSFWAYAVGHWMDFVRSYMADLEIRSLVQNLMDPCRPDLCTAWAGKYVSSIIHDNVDESSLATASPLHFASALALPDLCRWLLEKGCEPNGPSDFGTPLHCALLGAKAFEKEQKSELPVFFRDDESVYCKLENSEDLEYLDDTISIILDAGGDPNCYYDKASQRCSPLYLAARSHIPTASIHLFQKGAVLDDEALKEFSAESSHAEQSAYAVVTALGRELLREQDYARLLPIALKYSNVGIEVPPRPEIVTSTCREVSLAGYGVALRAAAEYGQLRILDKLLIDYSLDVNDTDTENGMTALHYAAKSGHVDVLSTLIDRGAHCSLADFGGVTPVHCAIQGVESACLALLLQQGVDHCVKDNRGFSLWHFAAEQSTPWAFDVLRDHVVRRVLNETLSDQAHSTGHTLRVQKAEYSRILATFCNSKSADGSTPLHIAVDAGYLRTVQHLIENGSNLKETKADGSNALHCAVIGQEYDLDVTIIKTLCDNGLDPCVPRLDGMTPTHLLFVGNEDCMWDFARRETVLRLFLRFNGDKARNPHTGLTALLQVCRLHATHVPYYVHDWDRKESYWNEQALQIMLQHGADSQTLDRRIWTVLQELRDNWEAEYLAKTPRDYGKLLIYANMVHTGLTFAVKDAKYTKFCQDPNLLSIAIHICHDTLTHLLLDQSPDVDQKSYRTSQKTPIENACFYGCNEPLLDRFLAKSKALSDRPSLGSGLIREACEGNSSRAVGLVTQLLESGLDPNGTSAEGKSALMLASRRGNVSLVENLLTKKANPHGIDSCGWSIVHYACQSGSVELLSVVNGLSLDWNARVFLRIRSTCYYNATALHISASHKYSAVLEYILDNGLCTDINSTTSSGETALLVASSLGLQENDSLLLSHDADDSIFMSGFRDESIGPLHVAAANGLKDVVLAFISHNRDTQLETNFHLTPEMHARRQGHLDVARILKGSEQRSGSNRIAARSSRKASSKQLAKPSEPLRVAVQVGDLELCKRLVEDGADLSAGYLSCAECTPLLHSLVHGQKDVATYLVSENASLDGASCQNSTFPGYTVFHYATLYGWVDFLVLLLKKSPRRLDQIKTGIHPIHVAIREGHKDCLNKLLEHAGQGASALVNLPIQPERWEWVDLSRAFFAASPLHLAARHQDTSIAKALLNEGARVDAINDDYQTPLHSAAGVGNVAMVELLLENGAFIDALDAFHISPCMTATEATKPDALDLLIKRGANVQSFDQNRHTIVHYAAVKGKTRQLACGIISTVSWWRPDYEDIWGDSVLSIALYNGGMDQVSFVLNLAPIYVAWEPHRSNVLTAAIQNRFAFILKKVLKRLPPDLIPELLAHRALIGGTPLYAACTMASPRFESEAINMLFDAGADLEHEGGDEGTPLMGACAFGRFAVVKLLVSKGARLCYEKDGRTISALHAAKNYPKIRRWLLVGRFVEGPRLLTSAGVNDA